MNLNRFIDRYGDCACDEISFTEVDNVIFSLLSYLNFDGLVSNHSIHPRRLQDVANAFFSKYSFQNKNIYIVKKAIKLFRNIKDTKRYRDLLL